MTLPLSVEPAMPNDDLTVYDLLRECGDLHWASVLRNQGTRYVYRC